MHTRACTLSRRSDSRLSSARTSCWSAAADGGMDGGPTMGIAVSAETPRETRSRFTLGDASSSLPLRARGPPPRGATASTADRLEFVDAASGMATAVGMDAIVPDGGADGGAEFEKIMNVNPEIPQKRTRGDPSMPDAGISAGALRLPQITF